MKWLLILLGGGLLLFLATLVWCVAEVAKALDEMGHMTEWD